MVRKLLWKRVPSLFELQKGIDTPSISKRYIQSTLAELPILCIYFFKLSFKYSHSSIIDECDYLKGRKMKLQIIK